MASRSLTFLVFLSGCTAFAQKACGVISDNIPGRLVVADGYECQLLAKGLSKPRGTIFDSQGHLLVVESGKGLTALTLKDEGPTGCVRVESDQPIVDGRADQPLKFNCGIPLDTDSKRLFVSSKSSLISYDYNPSTAKTIGTNYTTWLLLSRRRKTLMGMGLRNSIGMDEHPISGGIWSNENAADDVRRDKIDTHENVPGEEINFHGYLNGTVSPVTGTNYGDPYCASVWGLESMFKDASKKIVAFSRKEKVQIGKQFFVGDVQGMLPTGQLPTKGLDTSAFTVIKKTSESDATCQDPKRFTPPRLTLPPHWAPIDMRFNNKGTVAYMTSHGSWNKDTPDGYQLFAISWDDKGEPIHIPTSKTAAVAILQNKNVKVCSLMNKGCIHPTGLAFSPTGKLYMASDISGEIYVVSRKDGKSVDSLDSDIIDALGKKQYATKIPTPPILRIRQ
ncbi:Auxilliary activities family 12 protein [Venturia nashicola]|nr:Auxilliary activities family 12 protein [Venturia nashicola]